MAAMSENRPVARKKAVRVGLEVLLDAGSDVVRGRRIGLITNHTGVTRELVHGIDVLRRQGECRLEALLGPEHGVRGDAAAGQTVDNQVDPETGLPVFSLYGAQRRPTPEMLKGLDTLVFDLQDIGARYYTYMATLGLALDAAGEAGIDFVVLDRPNPLGGVTMDGNVLDPAFASFVGPYPVPVRHGLTAGELARLYQGEFGAGRGCHLTVVPMDGWRRSMWYDQTGWPWVPPTPNSTSLEMAALYPGTCLIEGTNASEGRGTTKPFECLGAPWVDAARLAGDLTDKGLPGVFFRPAHFTPTVSKHAGQLCHGVQVHLVDREAGRAVRLGLELVESLRRLFPNDFGWREARREDHAAGKEAGGKAGGALPDGAARRPFDLLAGTDRWRLEMEGGRGPADIEADWQAELAAFDSRRRPYLLY